MRDVAYGLRWRGPLHMASLAQVGGELPLLSVEVRREAPPPGGDGVDSELLRRTSVDGARALVVDRRDRRATFFGGPIEPETLVHPYLGLVASVYSRWIGRETFHAGGLLLGAGAWMVLGPREAGKSTLLAACHASGVGVLADDLCVVDDGDLLCGPRAIDLRRSPDGPLAGLDAVPARADRWRVPLPDVPVRVPLAGWVLLSWGEHHTTQPVPAAARVGLLARRRGWPALPSRADALLDLAARPGHILTRPRGLDGLGTTVEALVALAA